MAAVVCPSCIWFQKGTTQQLRGGVGLRQTVGAMCAAPKLSSSFCGRQSWGRRDENNSGFVKECGRSGARGGRGCWAHMDLRVNLVAVASETAMTTPMGLRVVETSEPNCRVRLSVTVPADVCKSTYDEVIREYGKKMKVPGFRPGKRIPDNVLVNYVGVQQVRASTVEAILKKTLSEAMSSVAGRALKESEHIVSRFENLEAAFSPDAPLSYDVAVDVAPEIKWVSDKAYTKLRVDVEIDEDRSRGDALKEFNSRLKDLGTLRVAEDRGLEMGAVAIIDISCNRINADGTLGDRVLSAEQKGFQLDSEDGANFLPGFVEALLGIQREETREFDLTFPQTWQQETLRGIHARFTGMCKEIFVRVLPEVDDAIASKLVDGCTTIDQVREQLLTKHQRAAKQAKRQATQLAIMEELAKVVEVEVPNSLLEDQGRQMYAAKLIELQTSVKLSKEQIVSLSSQEMVTNFLQSQKERIREGVKQTLAVAEIYKCENLQYSEEELNVEVESAVSEFKRYNQEYDEKRIREQAAELLEGSKVLDWLIANNEINYITYVTHQS